MVLANLKWKMSEIVEVIGILRDSLLSILNDYLHMRGQHHSLLINPMSKENYNRYRTKYV